MFSPALWWIWLIIGFIVGAFVLLMIAALWPETKEVPLNAKRQSEKAKSERETRGSEADGMSGRYEQKPNQKGIGK